MSGRTMFALGQKQTFAAQKVMSAKCQERTSSFNYLIGALDNGFALNISRLSAT